MEKEYLDLFTLQARLKAVVEGLFPQRLWVKAEVSSLSCKQNGHCYLELSQSEGGGVIAKARATIWAFRWNVIDRKFRSVAGSPLAAGMEILASVQVSYHPLYGFSLNVDDIDPEFTMGANERRRKETVDRLGREGLLDLQKRLQLPALPYSLAVISAPGAAGFGDFRHHLLDNEYGFVFNVKLFEALMQGEDAPASIMSAFAAILSSPVHYDAVLVMRGGGSDLDLACFDDYDLAVTIARFPVPVYTAIGHDKDHHVADMVANTSVKTPTALADLFLDCYIAEDQRLGTFDSRLRMAFANRLARMSSRLDLLESSVVHRAESRVSDALSRLAVLESNVGRRAESRISEALSRLLVLETKIAASDPRTILKKGFALTLNADGVRMASASGRKAGDGVKIMFADGTLECSVVSVGMKDNAPGCN
jgi:exodeoxyribonuclease VII large subunit